MIQMSLSICSHSPGAGELIEALRSVMRPARLDRGCASARLYSEVGNPRCFNYVEEWKSQEELLRNLRSGRFSRLIAIMEIAAEAPALRFSRVLDSDALGLSLRIKETDLND